MDDAMWGVMQEGWLAPWGSDADHLKHPGDLPPFVDAGYTFFTLDPGEHVDPAADTDAPSTLQEKIQGLPWSHPGVTPIHQDELVTRFEAFCEVAGWPYLEEEIALGALRAFAKYGRAVNHIFRMYRTLLSLKSDGFDLEISVDETESPTSLLEHFYIAGELKRLGVKFTSLAPRFSGRFEKGVDYIGDLTSLEAEFARHAAVMRHFGGYRISLHSGSDKFSVYPLLAKHTGPALHVKTAGTSYLEALRVTAATERDLFRRILALARSRYPADRMTYHVSAEEARLPDPSLLADSALPALMDDFHVRQALHVTFGSALSRYSQEIHHLLQMHAEEYDQALIKHFKRHLDLLKVAPAT
jgi:hypothetical protein